MKTGKIVFGTTILTVLLVSLMLPLLARPAAAATWVDPEIVPHGPNGSSKWQWIKTDTINLVFPASGEKPMFLWWYANDTSNIYVVKFKGLVEFVTFEQPYYRRTCEAEELQLREMLNASYISPMQHTLQMAVRMRIRERLMLLAQYYGLHRAYLPFSACEWNMTDPVEVTRGDVQYLSFNFTLAALPFPNMQFARDNVIIRCRFYYTAAEEDVEGLYSYSVGAGELKMDLIVRNWTWNIDLIQPFLNELAEDGIEVPVRKAGLALWVNLASIPLEAMDAAEGDLATSDGQVETASMTQSMYVEGARVGVVENRTLMAGELEQPLTARTWVRERYQLRYGHAGTAPLAGFFKYVPQALVRDGDEVTVVDVAASYIAAGHHLRLFLAYPYFGNRTLEHDPSLGLEAVPTLITPGLLLVIIGSASIVTIAVLAVRWKRKPVNIVGPQ